MLKRLVHYISEVQASGRAPLYQLKITLKRSRPPIWRRVLVRGDMRLNRLHDVVQIAMGWTNSHLHQFITGSRAAAVFYGMPDPDYADWGTEILNEKRFTLADIAPAAKHKFIYEYDFGDGWEHEIVAERILRSDSAFTHPVCLGGANACPPEDCGGIYGYYSKLEALACPAHPEHEEIREWMGAAFDPKEFSRESVNMVLKMIKPQGRNRSIAP